MSEMEGAGDFHKKKKKKKSFYQRAKKFGRQGRFGKGHEIDAETYNYFLRVLETLKKESFETPEEKSIFISNVLEQTSGKEVDISCNQLGSRVIELLLSETFEFRILERFMEALSRDLRVISTDPFGSHVLEKLLFLNSFREEGEEESLYYRSLWVLKVSKFAVNNLDIFVDNQYASHVLKTVFQVLSGLIIPLETLKSKSFRDQGSKILDSHPPYSFKNEGNEGFNEALTSVSDKVVYMADIQDRLWNSDTFSSVLQCYIYVLVRHDPETCGKLIDFFINNVFVSQQDLPSDSASFTQLIEMIASVSVEFYPRRFSLLYKRFFENKLVEISADYNRYFLVQKLLNACQDKDMFEAWYEKEFDEGLEKILNSGNHAILVSLAQCCNRLVAKQAYFSVALMKALHIYDSSSHHVKIVPLLSRMTNKEEYESSNEDNFVSKYGSLLIQELLKFNKPIKTVNSLLEMEGIVLLSLLSDPKGCHITDAFMTSKSIGEKSRDGLVRSLRGHFRHLASSKFGSRSFDELWKGASKKSQDIIASELSKEAELLKSNHFGKFIYNNLNLNSFKRNYDEWKSGMTTKEKKIQLFNDILVEGSDKNSRKRCMEGDSENKTKRGVKKMAKSYLDDL